jgi:hypothetical protein
MPRIIVLFVALLPLGLVSAQTQSQSPPPATDANWRSFAAPGSQGVSDLPETGAKWIYAPDRSSSIKMMPEAVSLVAPNGSETDLSNFIGSMNLTEFKYSDDSTAVFMNSSLGGLVGDWHTHIYRFRDGNAQEFDIVKVLRASGLPKSNADCDPNIYSIAWLRQSSQLLVLAEIPPSSGCVNMGLSRGYVVDLDHHRVIGSYSAKQYVKKFHRFLINPRKDQG